MPTEKRPTSVTVIGWFWMVFGVYGSVQVAVAWLRFRVAIWQMGADQFHTMPWYFRFSWVYLYCYLIFMIFGSITGFFLLRRRPWARRVLEIWSWYMLLNFLASGIYLEMTLLGMKFDRPRTMIVIFGTTLIVLLITIFSVPFALVVRFLRKPRIRQVFARSTPADSPPESPVDPLTGPPADLPSGSAEEPPPVAGE